MAEVVKLTKNELRAQQRLLRQLQRYLPTLQLKKAMLQGEVRTASLEIEALKKEAEIQRRTVNGFAELLLDKTSININEVTVVQEVKKRYENIAGVEVPYFEQAVFKPCTYSLFSTPPWVDGAVDGLRALIESFLKVEVAEEKKRALQRELREVSIRVNLFEKVLIPKAQRNIKKIRVFLGDQELAAVGQAKVAKTKIEKRKCLEAEELAHAH